MGSMADQRTKINQTCDLLKGGGAYKAGGGGNGLFCILRETCDRICISYFNR